MYGVLQDDDQAVGGRARRGRIAAAALGARGARVRQAAPLSPHQQRAAVVALRRQGARAPPGAGRRAGRGARRLPARRRAARRQQHLPNRYVRRLILSHILYMITFIKTSTFS